MRAMLPPNLTRHYWETRRTYLAGLGEATGLQMTPWFQLTPMERHVAEQEVELFRKGIRAAEEEQDAIAALNSVPAAAKKPAAPEEPPARDSTKGTEPVTVVVVKELRTRTASGRDAVVFSVRPPSDIPSPGKAPALEECDCLACSAVAAFLKLTTAGAKSPVPDWRLSETKFAARNAALIDRIVRARSNGSTPGAAHTRRPESESAADEGSAGPDQPAAAPKQMTIMEALAKQGPPEWVSGTIGAGPFSGPVKLAFGSPLVSTDKLSQEVRDMVVAEMRDTVVAEIRRNTLRQNLLRGVNIA